MLIGKTFNRRCEKILCTAAELAEYTDGVKVSVMNISERLNLDRVEIRNSFQFLIELELIRAESIGGPCLYGHISITKKGLLKVKKVLD